jgi:beta-lactamase class A
MTDPWCAAYRRRVITYLRHEIGVVEAVGAGTDGARVAMAALTRTARPAAIAPDVDLAIGDAARTAFDELRRSDVAVAT